MFKSATLALSAASALMLSACSGTPRLDLPAILGARAEPEPVPSALLARCADELPIPPEIERDGQVSPMQMIQLSVLWSAEYRRCKERMDALVDYIAERQGKER